MAVTIRYLTDLKQKYLHQFEHAIDEWDLQSFSPESREAFLDQAFMEPIQDDLIPYSRTVITLSESVKWEGLSAEAELASYDWLGNIINTRQSYEQKLIHLCTQPSGIRGVPDPETIYRYQSKLKSVQPTELIAALYTTLYASVWQTRAKSLCLLYVAVNGDFSDKDGVVRASYHTAIWRHPSLIKRIHELCKDVNAQVRLHARNMYVTLYPEKKQTRQTIHSQMYTSLTLNVNAEPETRVILSPRVAMMALACWKRQKRSKGVCMKEVSLCDTGRLAVNEECQLSDSFTSTQPQPLVM